MPALFVSYRRDDSLDETRRLVRQLRERLGDDQVFLDTDAVGPGDDFSRAIADGIRSAQAILVVIGGNWLESRNNDGRRRLEDAGDYVRLEIELALREDIPIVPLLLSSTTMPPDTDLPPSLRDLSLRQAMPLNDTRFDNDVGLLARVLVDRFGIAPTSETSAAVGPILWKSLRAYPTDLLSLVATPKRHLAMLNQGSARDLPHAVTFLVLSILIGDLILFLPWPTPNTLGILLVGQLLAAVVTVWFAPLLCVTWRLVGARKQYRRVVAVWLYQFAILSLGLKVCGAIALIVLLAVDPSILDSARDAFYNQGASALIAEISGAMQGALWDVGALLIRIISLGTFVWCLASWGAYRRSLGLSRWRSAAALGLFFMFVVVPFALLRTS